MTEQETKAAAEPPLDCRVGLPQPRKITVWRDEQAELMDDMADLCEYWKRNRSKGRTSNAIRSALVMLAADIAKTTEPVPNASNEGPALATVPLD